jgi:uncharacterized RDD family membrane protein YckC
VVISKSVAPEWLVSRPSGCDRAATIHMLIPTPPFYFRIYARNRAARLIARIMDGGDQKLDTLQAVELAEGVEVRLRVAGPLLRGAAFGLDVLLQWVVIGIVSLVFLFSGSVLGFETSAGLISLLWFFMWWWYPVCFEASRWGATPGKKMLGLRVLQTSGSRLTIGQAILRNFLRYADGMPFLGFGFAGIPTFGFALGTMLATRRFQRLGDLAARTVVVYDRNEVQPAIAAPPPLEPLAPSVPLHAEEARAIGAFRDRAGLWSNARQVEIADHARLLSGVRGSAGVSRLLAIGHWLQHRS